MSFKKRLEDVAPQFEAGGKYEKLYPVYEAFARFSDKGLFSKPH